MEAFGTLTIDLSLKVDAATPEEGLQQVMERVSSEDIAYIKIEIITTNGKVHKVKYADVHNLVWFDCIE